ncbi:hypothetical protein GS501_04645 [Saccharibacter sp. 17.LH.SD]|uniref:hypothetical protein n=1 Tax=Saccharibacter sp. 17.LH.SD TaxID=2689393 RepID=UPI0013705412|nr:hypothetical protein [Saccharibacter sp. 17.LH.SD]MXV44334.1 hypothetical protein [Saccharibacter sp. 17.LH.SD]
MTIRVGRPYFGLNDLRHIDETPFTLIEQGDHYAVAMLYKIIPIKFTTSIGTTIGRISRYATDPVTPIALRSPDDDCFRELMPARWSYSEDEIPKNQYEHVATLGHWGQRLQLKYEELLNRLEEQQAPLCKDNAALLLRPFVLEEVPHPGNKYKFVPIVVYGNDYSLFDLF